MTNISKIREQFPILQRKVNGYPLVYFDNGATSQKPLRVIESITAFYKTYNSNIHRGVHTLSLEATEAFEKARKNIANFFNVSNDQQIVFTAGSTDSINLVAQGLALGHLKEGDEILLSQYEHHSNILPWQLWAERHKGKLQVIPLNEKQELDLDQLEKRINNKTKLIAVAHVSNTLGSITDVNKIIGLAKQKEIPVLIDGAQSAPHMAIDLNSLGADFFVCSAHKMYGPTGTGLLYLSEKWLKQLPLSRSGGGTIKTVSFEKTEYAEGALRFEAGTPDISGVIAFSEALSFMRDVGMAQISEHEHRLITRAENGLQQLGVNIYGNSRDRAGVLSFNLGLNHPFDVGTLLDKYGIAVRTGHHCTQPLMQHLRISGTVRMSFAIYNTEDEVDFFLEKMKKVSHMLG